MQIHNHFALSATGFSGKRYHDCNATYKLMRDTSDRICREFGLSVIEKPKRNKTKHIGEVHAEKNGYATRRQQIQNDIDYILKGEVMVKRFYARLQALGYTLERRGRFLRIKPDGYNKFFRLDRLGAQGIANRKLKNASGKTPVTVTCNGRNPTARLCGRSRKDSTPSTSTTATCSA